MDRHIKIYVETSRGRLSLLDIARITGIRKEIIRSRYYRGTRGDDLLLPLSQKGSKIVTEFRGRMLGFKEIAEITGVPFFDISIRYRKGLRGEDLVAPLKPKRENSVGKRFGSLTVIREIKRGQDLWCECRCVCGKICERRYVSLLKNDYLHSCGCMYNHSHSHLMSKTKEHKAWRHIKERCLNKNSHSYPDYGGRGITMCERWKESFENFFADMGYAPSPKHSIDRINNDGNYEPGNCRWATRKQQCNNKRTTIYIEFQNEIRPLSEWADILGVTPHRLHEARRRGNDMVAYIGRLFEERHQLQLFD